MKKLFIAILMLLAVSMATGCAVRPTQYTTELYPESYIIQVMEDRGWRPESIASFIVDINIFGLAFGVYDVKDALDFVYRFRLLVDRQDVSYRDLIVWLQEYQAFLSQDESAFARAGLILVSRHIGAFSSVSLINPQDQKILHDLADYLEAEITKYFL
jgi:hypothetical protein